MSIFVLTNGNSREFSKEQSMVKLTAYLSSSLRNYMSFAEDGRANIHQIEIFFYRLI